MSTAKADMIANRNALNNAIIWLKQQQNPDGSWGADKNIHYLTTASAVNALKSAGINSTEYYAGIAWLENHNASNVDFLARKIQTLFDRGNNLTSDLNNLQSARRDTNQRGWGLSNNYLGSPIDTALALDTLLKANINTGQTNAINFLQATQWASDGGWSILINSIPQWQLSAQSGSDFWITAKILSVLASISSPSATVNTLISNSTIFLSAIPINSSSLSLAQTGIALYRTQGLTPLVDSLITELLTRQSVTGEWDDEYTTSLNMQMLATVIGLNISSNNTRVSVTDQTLRSIINMQLGKNAFDNLMQGEILKITTLNLTNTGVTSLAGLENATNLLTLTVDSNVDLSAIAALTGVTVTVNYSIDICGDGIDQDGTGTDALCGDINDDGIINVADILLLQRHMYGLTILDAGSIERGDLYPATGNGQLNIQDLILLYQSVLAQ